MQEANNNQKPFLRLRRSRSIAALLVVGLSLLGGCSSQTESVTFIDTSVSSDLLLSTSTSPGVDPELFAYRSSWPAAETYIDLGETTYYEVDWYSDQRIRQPGQENSHVYFRSYRTGTRIR